MKKVLLIITCLTAALCTAQIKFEKGYYLDNNGNKTECLIRNKGWNDNPRQFEYKLTDESQEYLKTIDEASEFGIYGAALYVRADVDMDRSSNKLQTLTTYKEPAFKKERLFLKVLHNGDYVLYSYDESGLSRFFYKKPAGEITQLVFKKYFTHDKDAPAINYTDAFENNQFRNQLWNEVKCSSTNLKTVENLKYTESSLVKYFQEVNACGGTNNTQTDVFVAKTTKGKFNVKAAVGMSMLKLDVQSSRPFTLQETAVNFGAEVEYILGTNKGKWSVILDPAITSFSQKDDDIDNAFSGQVDNVKVKFKLVTVSLGMRHYMFLNNDSKFFASGVFNCNFFSDSSWNHRTGGVYIAPSHYNFGLGFGYEYKRISAEFRYFTPFKLNPSLDSDFSNMSLTARYKIF